MPSELGRKEFVLVALVAGRGSTDRVSLAKGSGSVTAFSQADGFLEIDALANALDAGTIDQGHADRAGASAPDLVIMGSHCVALDVVVGALAERGFSARTIAIGSLGGVAAARRGECDLAPVHLIDPATGLYNTHLVENGLSLVQGLAAHAGLSLPQGRRALRGQDRRQALAAALADPDCLMVNRNAGAGTRILIDQLLGRRAAARLRQSAALAQRGRGRGRAGPRRLGHRDRVGGAHVRPRRSCRSRRRITISCWSRTGATGPACRRFSPSCATRRRASASARSACARPNSRICLLYDLGTPPYLLRMVCCKNAIMRIIGLAGWSGAGKTTLLTRVIPRLIARGLRVSTIKHAHHGFDVDQPGKDSLDTPHGGRDRGAGRRPAIAGR